MAHGAGLWHCLWLVECVALRSGNKLVGMQLVCFVNQPSERIDYFRFSYIAGG